MELLKSRQHHRNQLLQVHYVQKAEDVRRVARITPYLRDLLQYEVQMRLLIKERQDQRLRHEAPSHYFSLISQQLGLVSACRFDCL